MHLSSRGNNNVNLQEHASWRHWRPVGLDSSSCILAHSSGVTCHHKETVSELMTNLRSIADVFGMPSD